MGDEAIQHRAPGLWNASHRSQRRINVTGLRASKDDGMADAQTSRPAHDWRLIAAGAAGCAAGFYFLLAGFGLLPPPNEVNGPVWLLGCFGLVFFAPSVTALVRGWLNVAGSDDLPADAPPLLVAAQWTAVSAAMIGLCFVGAWVAFGAGKRHFEFTIPLPPAWAEAFGRTMFGFGTVVGSLLMLWVAGYAAKYIFTHLRKR